MDRIIAAERARLRITQNELAHLLGVSPRTLYNWEGNPGLIPGWALLKLSDLFGVSADKLLGREEMPSV